MKVLNVTSTLIQLPHFEFEVRGDNGGIINSAHVEIIILRQQVTWVLIFWNSASGLETLAIRNNMIGAALGDGIVLSLGSEAVIENINIDSNAITNHAARGLIVNSSAAGADLISTSIQGYMMNNNLGGMVQKFGEKYPPITHTSGDHLCLIFRMP